MTSIDRRALFAAAGAAALAGATPAFAATPDSAAQDGLVAAFTAQLTKDARSGWIGNPSGDVTLIQFFDYNCPYSRAVEPRVEALLKSDPGVRLILKEFAIENDTSSPFAARAALASLAQGNDKYAAYHQAMMSYAHAVNEQDVITVAGKVGLDVERLKTDMAAPAAYDQVIANLNLARALRVFTTPTFIAGGHVVATSSSQIDFPALAAQVRAGKVTM